MSEIEPHADIREVAATHRQMFVAWKQAGFDDAQAMRLLVAMVTAWVGQSNEEQQ